MEKKKIKLISFFLWIGIFFVYIFALKLENNEYIFWYILTCSITALGMGLNVLVIFKNNGKMPVYYPNMLPALYEVLNYFSPEIKEKYIIFSSNSSKEIKLPFLADRYRWLFKHKVLSIGDYLIFFGAMGVGVVSIFDGLVVLGLIDIGFWLALFICF